VKERERKIDDDDNDDDPSSSKIAKIQNQCRWLRGVESLLLIYNQILGHYKYLRY
jgi:hypothetical protein